MSSTSLNVLIPRLLPVLASLLMACSTVVPVKSQSTQPILLPYSINAMAFDGDKLWQVVHEGKTASLLAQTPEGVQKLKVTVQAELPKHRSLAWGQDKLWLLDRSNTLYAIDSDGKLVQTVRLELPEPSAGEQIIWSGNELWLLHASYLNTQGRRVTPHFYQIDPASGKILKTLVTSDAPELQSDRFLAFAMFLHQNLAARDDAFYVARGNIFEKAQNAVYRIDRSSGKVTLKELGRVYTGISSAFFKQGEYFGIELIDTSNCGDYCRGKLEKLALPE